MSILITGGAGYIGSHVAALCHQAGLQAVVLDNFSSGRRRHVATGACICAEIADTNRVRQVLRTHRVSCVIHLAAKANAAESILRADEYYENNVAGSLALLNAMAAEKVRRLVFASTCSVYGNMTSHAAGEADAVFPVSPYGVSKLAIEQVLPGFERANDLQWIALRLFNVAGAEPGLGEDLCASKRIITSAVRAALWGGRPLTVFGSSFPTIDGSAVRDYVHVADVARATLAALRYLEQGSSGAVVNIGSGQGTSVLDILETVTKLTGRPLPYSLQPARAGDPPYAVSDISRAAAVLDWKPAMSGIETIVGSVLHAAYADRAIPAVA